MSTTPSAAETAATLLADIRRKADAISSRRNQVITEVTRHANSLAPPHQSANIGSRVSATDHSAPLIVVAFSPQWSGSKGLMEVDDSQRETKNIDPTSSMASQPNLTSAQLQTFHLRHRESGVRLTTPESFCQGVVTYSSSSSTNNPRLFIYVSSDEESLQTSMTELRALLNQAVDSSKDSQSSSSNNTGSSSNSKSNLKLTDLLTRHPWLFVVPLRMYLSWACPLSFPSTATSNANINNNNNNDKRTSETLVDCVINGIKQLQTAMQGIVFSTTVRCLHS